MTNHNTLPPDDNNRIELETLVDALVPKGEKEIGQPSKYVPSSGKVLKDGVNGTIYLGDGDQWLPVTTDTGLATSAVDIDRADLTDNAQDPTTNGEIRRNGPDIKAYTGGSVKNLSDIGGGASKTTSRRYGLLGGN